MTFEQFCNESNPLFLLNQCVMPSLIPNKYVSDPEYQSAILALVERGVGGFCVFQGELEQTIQVLAELQAHADIPLLFSADYEHGLPMRLQGGTDFPHAMAMAKNSDTELTLSAAKAIARETRAVGVHWNFAPVCDVNSNKDNPIINTRAFGETVEEVIPQIEAWIKGSQAYSILSCAKHFPGHGDTAADSHISMPILNHTRQRLDTVELAPFVAAIKAGVDSIMVAHIAVPILDETLTPASLSKPIITHLLRNQMQFEGLIVTDALDMHAIAHKYTSVDATLRCLEAGADIALVPDNPSESCTALEQHSQNKSQFFLEKQSSLERIYHTKFKLGLLQKGKSVNDIISQEEHALLALKIAQKATTVIENKPNTLPINQYSHIAAFALLGDDDSLDAASEFFHYLAQVYDKNSDIAYINSTITDDDIHEYAQAIGDAECIVYAIFARARSYSGTVGIAPSLLPVVRRLTAGRPSIAIIFGNPYIAETFPADVFVLAYSDSLASRGAACIAISDSSISL